MDLTAAAWSRGAVGSKSATGTIPLDCVEKIFPAHAIGRGHVAPGNFREVQSFRFKAERCWRGDETKKKKS